ncbi:hypothetical protein Tco_1544000, partial [Tanacetum coccineum]
IVRADQSERVIPGKGDLRDYWRDISTDLDFLGPPPSYTLIRDPVLRLCHTMMAHSIAGRSQALEKAGCMDQDSAHMVAASKVSMLKHGEYEIWRMRIEQYIQMIDYALWEVI